MEMFTPEVLISEEDIELRVKELGTFITNDYAGEEVTILCVLKGAFIFCADLIKQINIPCQVEFISLSSYGDSTTSSGEIKVSMDITGKIEGKNVIIVEDIVDTGLTLKTLKEKLEQNKPRTIRVASLLYKPSKTVHDAKIDYLAFEIEDKFVIGYGLDYAGRYRELPYIGVLNAGH